MTIHTIKPANWHMQIADAIKRSDDGDTLIVHTDAQKELAERALARMRPGLKLTIEVNPLDMPG